MPSVTAARRALTAGLTVTLALALTAACQNGLGNRADAPATAVSPAPGPPHGGTPPTGPGGRVACTPEMLRFHAGAPPRTAHRMLLTVTNYGYRTCDFAAQGYPLLHFGDGRHRAVPVIGDSRPRAVVRLAPNRSAYAMVRTGTAGGRHHTAGPAGRPIAQFGMALNARATPVQVGLDGRTPVRVDPPAARVTYWQPSREAALKW
ncbi:DUF4232 domain-containing protein [Streptomyces sp. NPDC020742]|uniref:DUF4232 domain-containing protein n=1 Tax=Streptomyces sp. NPDC020742 TaxID=3154897 RepID=UPI0033EC0F1B